MKKQEVIDEIRELHTLMWPLVKKAGAQDKFQLHEDYPIIHMKYLTNALEWMRVVRHGDWSAASHVRLLLPEYVWDNYERRGERGLREVKLLDAAFLELRRTFKSPNRPDLFRPSICAALIKIRSKHKNEHEEPVDTEPQSVG